MLFAVRTYSGVLISGTYQGELNTGLTVNSKNVTIKAQGTVVLDAEGMRRAFSLVGSQVTLINIKIINGYSASSGGAVYIIDSTLSMVQGEISACQATGSRSNGGGGAIHLDGESVLDISGTKFQSNTASHGGAILLASTGTAVSTISSATFFHNTAISQGLTEFALGGAVYVGSGVNFAGCTLFGNKATSKAESYGGAIHHDMHSARVPLDIHTCTFEGNTALRGGAVSFEYQTALSMVRTSVFNNNTAIDQRHEIWAPYRDESFLCPTIMPRSSMHE